MRVVRFTPGATAYIEAAFPATDRVFLAAGLSFDQAVFNWSDFIARFMLPTSEFDNEGLWLQGFSSQWTAEFSWDPIPGHLEVLGWHEIAFGYAFPDGTLTVDGVTATGSASGVIGGTPVDRIRIGPFDAPGEMLLSTVKIGTTVGAGDVVDFDAATDDLSEFRVVGAAAIAEVEDVDRPVVRTSDGALAATAIADRDR